MIQPAPGVMLEHEWPHWLPHDILFPVGRIRLSGPTAEGYAAAAAAAPEMARDLASAGADVIAYACTIGSLFQGVAAERALVDTLASASGKPVISLSDTCIRALRSVGATRLAVMTPYTAETNGWVEHYVAAQGLAVAGFIATPVSIVTVGNLPPEEIAALAITGMAALPDADALWIPCTAIQTMEAIATIEIATDRPVISGTQALLWHALKILGVDDAVRHAGRLWG
ncbi:aspartate/glutamate racemase family protein [Sphingomonas sp. AR_OL41]|uniref:maleate cis-trans isomerase family protein n=1 Tax=Sphingomonas sp. AR_OL41 TaxID=3042729 RepID=UPI002480BA45|nr:aspartate/glutamate racemase family protein [Sphingomonas sp. AR_OL41]MDH7973224.1 aspartate/glutamate racemase family protein [Sphingomonas sp. AR_OL41]